jgi:hypothetical protein
MAPAGCRTHRHASCEPITIMIISYIHIYHITFGHIISQHTLQKQVRRPLLCCKFYVAAMGWLARTVLTYAKPQRWYSDCFLIFERTLFIESNSTKVRETDTRQPPLCTSACQSVEPVSCMWTCKVGPGRFIPQYHRIKKKLVTVTNMNINAHNFFVFYSCHCSGILHGNQKNSTHTQALSMEMHSYERGECVYVPHRS